MGLLVYHGFQTVSILYGNETVCSKHYSFKNYFWVVIEKMQREVQWNEKQSTLK